MAYTTLGIHPDHGQRARELAKHLGMPVAAYIGTLIDLQYKALFGREPVARLPLSVEESPTDWRKTKLLIETKTGPKIAVASVHVRDVAEMIRTVAERGGARMNLDLLVPISVGRKGSGVVIEATGDNGKPAKITLSCEKAVMLADQMVKTVADYAASDPK